ncbi:Fe-S cluster assembly protein SufD [Paracoccaceae bacterium GXU_MW_L88]
MAVSAPKRELAQALLADQISPADWMEEAVEDATQRLSAMGGPVGRDEYWRFTNPGPLVKPELPKGRQIVPSDRLGTVDALTICFVDGRFSAEKSDDLSGTGVEVTLLKDAGRWAKGLYGKLEARGQNPVPRPLAALNTARAVEGVALRVTATPEKPIALRYETSGAGKDVRLHHLVDIAEGASLTLFEYGQAGARSNVVIEANVADRAELHHLRTQSGTKERLVSTALFAELGEETVVKSCTLVHRGAMTRNEAVFTLNGDNANAHVAGASLIAASDSQDDTIFITHDAQDCESRQVFKKVLRETSKGVFQGKILVQPDAQKTDGYQISQGLLLDERAQFLAKPELEIYADDVACSHGSTCGAVDPTQLFYLTSRGVSKKDAENMLVRAFVDEAITEIADEDLQELMREQIVDWMADDAV